MWTKVEDLQNIESNALPVYDNRYVTGKIKTYDDKVYTNFYIVIVPVDVLFTIISIDCFLAYENKYYL